MNKGIYDLLVAYLKICMDYLTVIKISMYVSK